MAAFNFSRPRPVLAEITNASVPEGNSEAMALTQRHSMREVFGCARMYYGPAPVLPEAEIFGVTTFELG